MINWYCTVAVTHWFPRVVDFITNSHNCSERRSPVNENTQTSRYQLHVLLCFLMNMYFNIASIRCRCWALINICLLLWSPRTSEYSCLLDVGLYLIAREWDSNIARICNCNSYIYRRGIPWLFLLHTGLQLKAAIHLLMSRFLLCINV